VKQNNFLVLIALCSVSLLCAQTNPPRRVRLGPALPEISGLARTPDGALWALNDGGHPAALYRLEERTGRVLETRNLPVRNYDWEDLCADPSGRLYIGDVGNNSNNRRDLRIYRYDPATGALDSILFAYPDQQHFPPRGQRYWNFDCEAMAYHRDSLHLWSKNRFTGNFYVKHYVLPIAPGNCVAQLRDSFLLPNRVVTGAALSPDGQTLALTAYIVRLKHKFWPYTKADVFFFSGFKDSNFFTGRYRRVRLPKFLIARQFESVVYVSGSYWLAANERRGPHKARLWRVRH
jgi:hypothetical protein